MVELRAEVIVPRLKSFLKYMEANTEEFGGSKSVLLLNGKQKAGDSLTAALQMHFLEYEFPDTAMLLTKSTVHVLTSASKAKYLQEAADKAKEDGSFRIETILRNKKSGDSDTIEKLVQLARTDGPCAVVELSEELLGSFGPAVLDAFKAAGKPAGDQSPLLLKEADEGVQKYLTRKDVHAQDFLVRSAQLSTRMYRKVLLDAVETVLDEGNDVKHRTLAQQCSAVLQDDAKFGKLKLSKLDQDHCGVSTALVQSGGSYTSKLWESSSGSEDSTLSPDVILVSLGCAYRSYHSLVGRTLLINPTDEMSKAYSALQEAHGIVLDRLRDGGKISDAVIACESHLRSKMPSGTRLPDTFGHATGLVDRERPMILSAKNHAVVKAGQVLTVITAAEDIPINDAASAPEGAAVRKLPRYSLCLSDTILVLAKGQPEPNKVLTQKAPKDLEDVSYDLADSDDEGDSSEDDDDAREKGRAKARKAAGNSGRDAEGRSMRLAAKVRDTGGAETAEKRAIHQAELRERQIKEMQAKILSGEGGSGSKAADIEVKPIVAYSGPAKLPRTEKPTKISVDKEREIVLLPMMGQLLPVHIATIRNVTKTEEDGLHMLRFNFYTPQSAAGKECLPAMVKSLGDFAQTPFIRSLNFTSKDSRNMNLQLRLIKDMQKRARQAAQLEKEEAAVKEQPKLIIDRTQKTPRLQRLQMWPKITGRKTMGNLEAHSNGLRFRSARGEQVDIIYSNVRHAVFQPCKNEHIVLIHFHLKNPIMVGKKSRKDIQFYAELIETSNLLDNKQRALGDADEIEEERREREMRRRMNDLFKKFASRVEKIAARPPNSTSLEFETPLQSDEMQFKGAPLREMVTISTTTSALVSLAEKPPFVLSLDDVEHVHFETAGLGSAKSFDLVFVLKEGRAEKGKDEFVRISAIPVAKMDMIQDWLDEVVEQTFTVGRSLNWKTFIQTHVRDPRFYFDTEEDGTAKPFVGWEFFLDTSSLSDEEGSDDDAESEFGDDSDDLESEEDDDDEFDSAVEEEEESDEESEEDEEDEEAADWDELDRQAAKDDKKRDMLDREQYQDRGPAGSKRKRASGSGGHGKGKRKRVR